MEGGIGFLCPIESGLNNRGFAHPSVGLVYKTRERLFLMFQKQIQNFECVQHMRFFLEINKKFNTECTP